MQNDILVGRLIVSASLFVFSPSFSQEPEKPETDFQLEIQLDYRYFFEEGSYPGQERSFISASARPEYSVEWDKRRNYFQVALFGRWDQHDAHRTHADIRELYYRRAQGNWEFSVGFKKIFWGVTESVHLVDIINQTDQVESFDGEQKLGQSMLHFSYLTGFGIFDLFYMPHARKRQFPAEKGRFRFPVVIERDDLDVDSDLDEFHPSFAFRWSHYFGPIDIGVSNFYGVGREPLFTDLGTPNAQFFYPIINQTGFDLQATTGPVLWKFETIYRYAEQQDFLALASGLEYTFANIASSGLDIGVLGEYLYDSRDTLAFSSLDNDLFLGSRLAFNDVQSSQLLAGVILDLNKSTTFYSVEGSRRIGSSWKFEIESRIFRNVSNREFAYFFRADTFIQLRIARFF